MSASHWRLPRAHPQDRAAGAHRRQRCVAGHRRRAGRGRARRVHPGTSRGPQWHWSRSACSPCGCSRRVWWR
jgi:hypothetical protein